MTYIIHFKKNPRKFDFLVKNPHLIRQKNTNAINKKNNTKDSRHVRGPGSNINKDFEHDSKIKKMEERI